MYKKIAKYIFWILFIAGFAILALGFVNGFTVAEGSKTASVYTDLLLNLAYVLFCGSVGLTIILTVVIDAFSDPKSLARTGLGILIIGVVALISYFLASGAPLVGYMGVQPSQETLKITDTLLNVTYILSCGAILAIILGQVVMFIRNK